MSFQEIYASKSQSSQPQHNSSRSTPRPFAVQAKEHESELTGLQNRQNHGTITPVEQEKLGILQAKMQDSLKQELEQASRFGHNLSNITVHPPDTQAIPVQSGSNPIRRACQPRIPEARSPIQAKLTIGQPNDKYEQEADRVAAQIVRQITAPVSAQPTQQQSVQRQNGLKEKIQASLSIPALQRREAVGGGEASTNLESAINSARGGGQSLDAGLQQAMGQAMGADFSGVKVHTDSQSDQLNRSIQAKAFTTGQDVFFRQGEYNPGSRGGQELIAHELTHVVQQNAGVVRRLFQQPQKNIVQRKVSSIQGEDLNETEALVIAKELYPMSDSMSSELRNRYVKQLVNDDKPYNYNEFCQAVWKFLKNPKENQSLEGEEGRSLSSVARRISVLAGHLTDPTKNTSFLNVAPDASSTVPKSSPETETESTLTKNTSETENISLTVPKSSPKNKKEDKSLSESEKVLQAVEEYKKYKEKVQKLQDENKKFNGKVQSGSKKPLKQNGVDDERIWDKPIFAEKQGEFIWKPMTYKDAKDAKTKLKAEIERIKIDLDKGGKPSPVLQSQLFMTCYLEYEIEEAEKKDLNEGYIDESGKKIKFGGTIPRLFSSILDKESNEVVGYYNSGSPGDIEPTLGSGMYVVADNEQYMSAAVGVTPENRPKNNSRKGKEETKKPAGTIEAVLTYEVLKGIALGLPKDAPYSAIALTAFGPNLKSLYASQIGLVMRGPNPNDLNSEEETDLDPRLPTPLMGKEKNEVYTRHTGSIIYPIKQTEKETRAKGQQPGNPPKVGALNKPGFTDRQDLQTSFGQLREALLFKGGPFLTPQSMADILDNFATHSGSNIVEGIRKYLMNFHSVSQAELNSRSLRDIVKNVKGDRLLDHLMDGLKDNKLDDVERKPAKL